jgi:acetyl-CoA hydrolase
VGNIANSIFTGFSNSSFEKINVWTEVLQDSMIDLLDNGKINFISTCSIALSNEKFLDFYKNFDFYKEKICLRQQGISNHPELIKRLKLISMNSAIEADIYGHVNSTHINGSKIIHGIGGSGDFFRNAYISIVHFPSTRPTPTDPTGISAILPMVSHVDHTEQYLFF